MNNRLLYVLNDADFFLSHRLLIARAASSAGYEVHVATGPGRGVAEIIREGFVHHEVPLSRTGRNPLREIGSLLAICALMGSLKPALVHLVTIKPVLYGGIAARFARVPAVVIAISGLGYLFSQGGLPNRLYRAAIAPLYRFALRHPNLRVVFQNSADREALAGLIRIPLPRSVLLRGSGVDLECYRYLCEPSAPLTVVFASRLLRAKGICEFVEAARRLRRSGHDARFLVCGSIDGGNPTTVTQRELARWMSEGNVEVLGHRTDIPDLFARSHIVVLPSYYGEGMPKVLLEAAACGRAVVTTDHPGCRDAVEPGVTGLLVRPRDPVGLASAIETLLLDAEKRKAMGAAGRRMAESAFSVGKVVERHLQLYGELTNGVAR